MLASCHHAEEVAYSNNACKKNPAFIKANGFDEKKSYFSTSDLHTMGLLLLQSEQPGNPAAAPTKIYQHPSWKKGGWLAPILIDDNGNVYTAPVPFINVWNNPAANQNTIYKVDGSTGEMNEYLKLPIPDTTDQNAFGIIGLAYLCETQTLYASSIAGSDRAHERGAVYAISTTDNTIIDKIAGVDAMGMGITYITGERRLFFGTGRSSSIYSIALNEKGKFSGKPAEEFSLSGLGPRGDDKVRRITADKNGNLQISSVEFNYNLIAPQEKQDTRYIAVYDADAKKWSVSAQ